ncbi:MAG TPA: hypothetical protein VM734_22910 [Kofleriaceae bacterium]|nr:hypothetical protein [Kofleriaceae bacterium]
MTRDDHDDPDLRDDDDLRLGPIPGPDAPADAGEKTRARAFGDLVDKVLAGRTPAAVPAEDRALLEVATALRAAVRPVELPAARQRAVVEAALATAIERRGGGGGGPRLTDPSIAVAGDVVPLRRARARRLAPWIVAGVSSAVAAAAIALLVLGRAPQAPAAPQAAQAAPLPAHLRSRPADALIGAIPGEASGDALGRIDTIYSDRLAGYRERTLGRAPARGSKP